MSFSKPLKFGKKLKKEKNPLDEIEYIGNAATDSLAEMSVVESEFKARAKEENKRFIEATDSEYWIALCFQTRAQKEEFLEKLKLIDLGDKYLDGLKVAKRLNVDIESPTPADRKFKVDKVWDSLT